MPLIGVGSVDPRDTASWIDAVLSSPLVTQRQQRTQDRLRVLVESIAWRADWETLESWPTWARMMAETGWARSTLAGWLAELRLYGWLILLESGSTPETTAMAVRLPDQGNRAAVYGLRIPHTDSPNSDVSGDKTWTPTGSLLGKEPLVSTSSRARNDFHSPAAMPASTEELEALRARIDEKGVLDFRVRVPSTPGQMLAAAAALQREGGIWGRLSRKAIRVECRAYWAAGWTNLQVLHAVRYRPRALSPLPVMPTERVVAPGLWLRSRLGAWRDERGRVLLADRHHGKRIQAQLIERHGRAVLPAWQPRGEWVSPADLRLYASTKRDLAAETIAVNQHADIVAARSAPRNGAEVCSGPQLQLHLARVHAIAGQRQSPAAPPRARRAIAPDTLGDSVHERALRRARQERRRQW